MRRTWGLLALAAFMAIPLSACERQPTDEGIPTVQGGGTDGGGAPTLATTADVLAAMGEWAQCMRDQGFDVPDPHLDPASGKLTFGFEHPAKGDPMEDLWVTAVQVCEPLEMAYQELDRRPFSDEQMALWRVYTECMRDNGVEVDDPDQESGIRPVPDPRRYRDQASLTEQARQACQDELAAALSAS